MDFKSESLNLTTKIKNQQVIFLSVGLNLKNRKSIRFIGLVRLFFVVIRQWNWALIFYDEVKKCLPKDWLIVWKNILGFSRAIIQLKPPKSLPQI